MRVRERGTACRVVVFVILAGGVERPSPIRAQSTYEPTDIRAARMIVEDFEADERQRRAEARRRLAAQRARKRARQDRASARALDQGSADRQRQFRPGTTDYRRLGAETERAAGSRRAGALGGAGTRARADREPRSPDPALGPAPAGPIPILPLGPVPPGAPPLEADLGVEAGDLQDGDNLADERFSTGDGYLDAVRDELLDADLELSAFERQVEVYEDRDVGRRILQFGYDVFGRSQDALLDVPVGGDYVLGAEDSLVVSIWGNLVDQDHRVVIDRDGQVRLPQVGPVVLKGLTLTNAEAVLRRRYDQFYRNYQLQVRVARLRDMTVHVVGRVAKSGRLRVPSVATLFDALAAAGGVEKDGSLRTIVVRRRGADDRTVDLYNYLLAGDLSVDISLSAGDAIVVPAVGPRVAVAGRALRPAIYELDQERISLSALLELAGGFARLANRAQVQVESVSQTGLSLRIADLSTTPGDEIFLTDGDVAIVRSLSRRLDNVVYVAGNVTRPGRYALRPGMRVSDVLTSEALINAGFWLDRLALDAADPRANLPAPLLAYALIRRLDPRSGQESRIAFHLGKAVLEQDPVENHVLQPQDTIVVFPRDDFTEPESVYISGAVFNEGDFRFFEGMRVLDLVRMSGGLRPEAHLRSAVLTRMYRRQTGVQYEHIHVDIGAVMAGDSDQNYLLESNDSLAVKTLPDFREPYRVKVEGEVRHPGTYTVIPGERLSDLLRRTGGFTAHAYLPSAKFFRESVRQLQQQRMTESLRRLELDTKLSAQRYTADATALGEAADVEIEQRRIESLIESIKENPALGRVVLRMRPPEELVGTPDDIELSQGDVLIIPRQPQEVNVIGAVFNQTALLYQKGLRARDYLRECGGQTDTADMELAYIIRSDGSADSTESARENFRWDGERGRYGQGSLLDSRLYPGDTLVIPYDVKPQLSKLGLTKTITQILFQVAVSTGVIVSIL